MRFLCMSRNGRMASDLSRAGPVERDIEQVVVIFFFIYLHVVLSNRSMPYLWFICLDYLWIVSSKLEISVSRICSIGIS